MSSLRPQDRKSLCRFTFADGRQSRTPRSPGHPHPSSDHDRKDSQSRSADKLASELSYFFSGRYLPPAISAPPSATSCPPSSAATSRPAPPAPSPISPKLSSKPSILPRTSTSTPSAPTPGEGPSAIPSARTSTTAIPPRQPNHHRIKLPM